MLRIKYLIMPVVLLAVLLFSYSFYYPAGSPGGYSGAPPTSKNCVLCHGGTATNQDGIITSDVPLEGYTANTTYNITVTLTGSGKKGYEVSVVNSGGNGTGTLIAGSNSKLFSSNTAITQTKSSTGNPAKWTFQWIAPSKGSGPIRFYGAFTVGMSKTLLSNITVAEKTGVSIENDENIQLNIYPNPVSKAANIKVSFYLTDSKRIKASIYSLEGKEVLPLINKWVAQGNQNFDFDLKNKLAAGEYLLIIRSNNKVSSKKILVY